MNEPKEHAVLSCRNVRKVYQQGRAEIEVLSGVDLTLNAGETLAIVGASGSGKTTLLNILGTLDAPSEGSVHILGQDVARLSDRQRAQLRNKTIGFVYQFHHLLPEFTALENVAMPLMLARLNAAEAEARARRALEDVGLAQRLDHKPGQLSGGERQRVAIARALVTNPALVFMDEPTGNLDGGSAEKVQQLLMDLASRLQTAFVLVTHDERLAARMQSVWRLDGGFLRRDLTSGQSIA